MDLTLTEAQIAIQHVAREFLQREVSTTVVRAIDADLGGFDPDLWRKMADLGWLGYALPSAYGGGDGTLDNLAILHEELGRVLTPGPYLTSSALGAQAVLHAGSEDQKREILPKVCSGNRILTVAQLEPGQDRSPDGITATATRHSDGYRLDGLKLFVPHASVADTIIVAARLDGEIALFLVDARTDGLTVRTMDTFPNDRPGEVRLEGVRVSEDRRLPGDGWEALEHANGVASVMLCAEMVGAMQYVLDLSVGYAKKRVQFGRPIGAFQAIQHKGVTIVTELTGARLITYQTAWRLQHDLATPTDISLAKAKCSRAYRIVTYEGHEIHGGIGWSSEYDLQLYFRRRTVDEVAFGTFDEHLDVIADAVLAGVLPQPHRH